MGFTSGRTELPRSPGRVDSTTSSATNVAVGDLLTRTETSNPVSRRCKLGSILLFPDSVLRSPVLPRPFDFFILRATYS